MSNKEQQHHELGMSAWPALSICPHFRSAPGDNADAKRGRDAHEALERLSNGLDAGELAPEWDDAAVWAAEWIKSQRGDGVETWQERRVEIAASPVLNGIFGTADFIGWDGATLTVADFKTFARKGEKDYFPQLAGYAVAWCQTTGELPDDIRLVVLCGLSKAAEERHTDYHTALRESEEIIRRAKAGIGERCTNHWCKYCKHYPCAACRAVAGYVQSPVAQIEANRDWILSNPAAVPKILLAVAEAEKLADSLKAWCKEAIEISGEETAYCGKPAKAIADPVSGAAFALVTQQGARKFTSVESAIDALANEGMTPQDLLACCTLSVPKIEKRLAKAAGITQKAAAARIEELGITERGEKVTLERVG